jgi:hypothetical protein
MNEDPGKTVEQRITDGRNAIKMIIDKIEAIPEPDRTADHKAILSHAKETLKAIDKLGEIGEENPKGGRKRKTRRRGRKSRKTRKH